MKPLWEETNRLYEIMGRAREEYPFLKGDYVVGHGVTTTTSKDKDGRWEGYR
jgi:hypothetical protein